MNMVNTIVTYDISDDALRVELQELLLDLGLGRIQRSTFQGNLNKKQRTELIRQIKKSATTPDDSICIIKICKKCASQSKLLSNTEQRLTTEQNIKFL